MLDQNGLFRGDDDSAPVGGGLLHRHILIFREIGIQRVGGEKFSSLDQLCGGDGGRDLGTGIKVVECVAPCGSAKPRIVVSRTVTENLFVIPIDYGIRHRHPEHRKIKIAKVF